MLLKIELDKNNIVDFCQFYNLRMDLSDVALETLFEYHEQMELETEITIEEIQEWDYTYYEYEEDEFITDYKYLLDDDASADDIMEELQKRQTVIKTNVCTYVTIR